MSSQVLNILGAIETRLATETASGGVLEDIGSYFVLRTTADNPPEYGAMTPMLIVSVVSESGEEICIPAIATRKELQVRFSLFTENGGDTTDSEAASLIDSVETVFRQQTFGYADWFDFISKSYTQTSIAGFSGTWNGVAEYICQYSYTDMIGG